MKTNNCYTIVITGAESCGKTTLAKNLASYFNTTWVKEYARTYIEKLNRPYNKNDLLIIAKQQGKLIEKALENQKSRVKNQGFEGKKTEKDRQKKPKFPLWRGLGGGKTIDQKILICDTDLLTIKIWSEYKYGDCDSWIKKQVEKKNADLYLVCAPDLPWTPDPQREHPTLRSEIHQIYLKNLQQYQKKYTIITGEGNERLQNAIFAIETLFF